MLFDTIAPIECNRKSTPSLSINTKKNNNNASAIDSIVGNNLNISALPSTSSSSSSKKRPRTSLLPSTSSMCKQGDDTIDQNVHPSEYARKAFEANGFRDLAAIASDSEARFLTPTAAMLDAYNTSIVQEVRMNNLSNVKNLYWEGQFQHGCNACNRFGESILHIACRRGHLEMVKFLIVEAGLSCATIRDDYNRTPLHDAFWTSTANPEIIDFLMQQPHVTELLLCKDKRGYTPLDYSRGEDREKWLRFLKERRSYLRPATKDTPNEFNSGEISLANVFGDNFEAIKDDSFIRSVKRQRIVG